MTKQRKSFGKSIINTDNQEKRKFIIDAIHILILWNFAVTQPLFDLLSRNAEFFVARHSKPIDIIVLILILCVVFPAILIAVEGLVGLLGRRVRKGVHGFAVAALVAIIVLPALEKIFELPGITLIAGAVIIGVGFTIAYIRFHQVRAFLTVLSPALLIFVGLFLFNSNVFNVVFPDKDPSVLTVEVDNPSPIIMVVFDELPITSLMDEHGQIDPIRYPSFAALARDAYWFRNTMTVAAQTTLIIPSMLTGNYPDPSVLPTDAYYPQNIFTLLGGSYALRVFESVTQLCPTLLNKEGITPTSVVVRIDSLLSDLSVVYLHILLPSDLTKVLPAIMHDWKDFIRDRPGQQRLLNKTKAGVIRNRVREFLQFIDSIDPTRQKTMYYLHTMLPHRPWEYLTSGKTYGVGSKNNIWDFLPHGKKYNKSKIVGYGIGSKGEIWGDDEWIVTQGYQLHLLQVGFVDNLLGQLIEKLKRVDLYNRSLIVVTADHGISFRPGEYLRVVGKSNAGGLIFVPLFIKAPNQQAGVVIDQKVQTIDILPTMGDILGIQLPWAVDGHSALSEFLTERDEVLLLNPKNEKLRFKLDSLLNFKQDAMNWKLDLFGSGTKSGELLKIGPHSHLVGRSTRTADRVEGDVTVELDQANFYANVDPTAAYTYSHITGRVFLDGNDGARLNLAISVNGKIQAVTRTFPLERAAAEWSAMVPETTFQLGRNNVEVFVISGDDRQPYLQSTRTYFLSASSYSGGIITLSDGKSISVIPNVLEGYLEIVNVGNGNVEFSGWAADEKNSQLPEAVVIFLNGKFIHSGRCNIDRPDVAKHFQNPALLGAGFKFRVPLSLFENIANPDVRIFAVPKKGVASELSYPIKYTWRKKS